MEHHLIKAKDQIFASRKDAAKLAGVSPATLDRMLSAGKFKAVKVGRLTRVSVASIEAYYESLPKRHTEMGAV